MYSDFNLPVFYEDEAFIVVDKPAGLPVHKNDFMPNDADYLTKAIGRLKGKSVYNVHRLDSKTSGVIILAFSREAASLLTRQFEEKSVEKTYIALAKGKPGEGTFDEKVVVKKKSKFKKPAITHYRTIKSISTGLISKDEPVDLSLVEVKPETGRWHQIRQHFARKRYDIIGDTHHGDFALNRMITEKTGIKRLMLHASEIRFIHPYNGDEIIISSEAPDEFFQTIKALEL